MTVLALRHRAGDRDGSARAAGATQARPGRWGSWRRRGRRAADPARRARRALPATGARADRRGSTCEYGSSPVQWRATPLALCNGGRWQVTAPGPGGLDCGGGPQGTCPVVVRVGARASRTARRTASICDYPQGRCACAVPAGARVPARRLGRRPTWMCQAPAAGCPQPRPLPRHARARRRRSSATTGRAPSQAATRRPAREGLDRRAWVACPALARP